MSRRYPQLTFTESVKQVQEHYGARASGARLEAMDYDDATLGPNEQAFLTARDSFYVASVLENGWPYLQHRGGPPGFLRVLDEHTLAFADFRGNRQYITTGAVRADDRVSLFLMDYPNRRRMKLMARAEVHEAGERPDLVERVAHPEYGARIERVVLLRVEAFDWNCPQHITPRYTADEWAAIGSPQ